MSSRDGIRWYCPNRECNWSFVAAVSGEKEMVQRCICGSLMRKGELVRAFRYLDFLREEREVQEEVGVEKG